MISQKQIEEEELKGWIERYKAAKADMNNREKAIANCMEELEVDMELLGVTGVEGKMMEL